MTKEKWTFDRIRERQPNFDRINAALDEFAAGQPVTQLTIDTNEPIVITQDKFLGVTYVTAGNRVLARSKYKPNFDLAPQGGDPCLNVPGSGHRRDDRAGPARTAGFGRTSDRSRQGRLIATPM